MSDQKFQYRVVSRRQDCKTKYKIYATPKAAENRLGLLTSSEPWNFYPNQPWGGYKPDDYACCSGFECGCGGLTVRESAEARRAELPPLVECWIEKRPVGDWEQHDRIDTTLASTEGAE